MKKVNIIVAFVLTIVVGLLTTPNVVTTLGVTNITATNIVNFILTTSDVASAISLIGIIFGVGGLSLATIQTVRYLAKKSFKKAVMW